MQRREGSSFRFISMPVTTLWFSRWASADLASRMAWGRFWRASRLKTTRALPNIRNDELSFFSTPLDVHWPALIGLRSDGTEALRRQHRLLDTWPDLEAEPINVQVFVPAGYEWAMDYPGFREYRIPVSDMAAADWALLLSADLIGEPRGRLLDEAHRKVTELGWQKAPNSGFMEAVW